MRMMIGKVLRELLSGAWWGFFLNSEAMYDQRLSMPRVAQWWGPPHQGTNPWHLEVPIHEVWIQTNDQSRPPASLHVCWSASWAVVEVPVLTLSLELLMDNRPCRSTWWSGPPCETNKSNPAVIGLARISARRGLRVPADQAHDVHQLVRPACSSPTWGRGHGEILISKLKPGDGNDRTPLQLRLPCVEEPPPKKMILGPRMIRGAPSSRLLPGLVRCLRLKAFISWNHACKHRWLPSSPKRWSKIICQSDLEFSHQQYQKVASHHAQDPCAVTAIAWPDWVAEPEHPGYVRNTPFSYPWTPGEATTWRRWMMGWAGARHCDCPCCPSLDFDMLLLRN